ncbi:MAG TPA: MFS transporter [Solirubrobacteraceae bacterium]|nr:MFS transporter [Solirubrobacteraceae bacterium]
MDSSEGEGASQRLGGDRRQGGAPGGAALAGLARRLNRGRARSLAALGLPALALSLGVTTVSGLLPVLLQADTGPLAAGALVGLEGIFALIVPSAVGRRARPGARLRIIGLAALLAAAGLVTIAIGGALPIVVVGLVAFYAAYFAYLTAYFAMYPDIVDEEERGRSQGAQGTWRALGLAIGFVAGPALIGLWSAAPFLLAAVVIVAVTPLFAAIAVERARDQESEGELGTPPSAGSMRRLMSERPGLARLLAANALWETALAALRAFVVLFLTVGLDRPEHFASIVLAIVVGAALVAAPLAGWLADRLGRRRVLMWALCVYAACVVAPALVQSVVLLPLVFLAALAAVTVMTLPFAVVMDLLGEGGRGEAAGLFGVSRGLGLLAGPLAAGAAITLLEPVFADTQGYAALFVVASVALAASIPLLRGVRVS